MTICVDTCCNAKMLRLFAITAALFVASCECAVVPSSSCSEQYQAALSSAVEIRDKCEGATLYDCCQVHSCCNTCDVSSQLLLNDCARLRIAA